MMSRCVIVKPPTNMNMKQFLVIGAVAFGLLAFAAPSADARHRHHRHCGHHHGGSNFSIGIGFGSSYPYGYGYGYSRYPYGYGYGYNAYPYRQRYSRGYGYGGGNVVVSVQQRLARAGYYRGSIDGIIGPGTRWAIRSWERSHGLPADGVIDRRLLATMGLT